MLRSGFGETLSNTAKKKTYTSLHVVVSKTRKPHEVLSCRVPSAHGHTYQPVGSKTDTNLRERSDGGRGQERELGVFRLSHDALLERSGPGERLLRQARQSLGGGGVAGNGGRERLPGLVENREHLIRLWAQMNAYAHKKKQQRFRRTRRSIRRAILWLAPTKVSGPRSLHPRDPAVMSEGTRTGVTRAWTQKIDRGLGSDNRANIEYTFLACDLKSTQTRVQRLNSGNYFLE